jgi:hypothetical protein
VRNKENDTRGFVTYAVFVLFRAVNRGDFVDETKGCVGLPNFDCRSSFLKSDIVENQEMGG